MNVTAGALSTALRARDESALADLVVAHGDLVYSFGYRRTASWSSAEQITRDAFATAWQRAEQAPEHDRELPIWLLGFAAAEVARLPRATPPDADESIPDVLTAEALSGAERLRWAHRILANHPPTAADAWLLVHWEGLTPAEAATVLDRPVAEIDEALAEPGLRPEQLGPDALFVAPDLQPLPDQVAEQIVTDASRWRPDDSSGTAPRARR